MVTSVLETFRIGIGPSSSHTMGPMLAARNFVIGLASYPQRHVVRRLRVRLGGSLAWTGVGHGTPDAIVAGLMGLDPENASPSSVRTCVESLHGAGSLWIGDTHLAFDPDRDIENDLGLIGDHPNVLLFEGLDDNGRVQVSREFLSIGGGVVLEPGRPAAGGRLVAPVHPFTTASELLRYCGSTGLSISEVMLANELMVTSADDLEYQIMRRWHAMADSVERGCATEGYLPGRLGVARRAPRLHALQREDSDSLSWIDRVTLYAMAVNEENAAGGRVVTAPTNGAAGVFPAVLRWVTEEPGPDIQQRVVQFFLVGAAIASIIKENASISGAEVGCQGEVGSACAMTAAALCEFWGGLPYQVENAAEIALEHHLGMTCDPVAGLVQIPCIERNGLAATKAVAAARLALRGTGQHRVTLDQAVEAMVRTGRDLRSEYRETSRGGLAVTVPLC